MTNGRGRYLKEIRERLGLGVREVQEASSRIAAAENNPEFHISAARLTQIESGRSMPSMFKLFSLAAIFGLDLPDLLRRFGLDMDRATLYRGHIQLDATHPVAVSVYGEDVTVTLPVRLDPGFHWGTTQLVNRLVAVWGEVPAGLLARVNPRKHIYGYIGLADLTMYPLLRPGSLVMVDDRHRRVASNGWQTEYERPLYFLELHDGYRCGWCQLRDSVLTLIPHPLSPCAVERFHYPQEAEIVGQVVAVVMRLVPPGQKGPEKRTRYPERSSSAKGTVRARSANTHPEASLDRAPSPAIVKPSRPQPRPGK